MHFLLTLFFANFAFAGTPLVVDDVSYSPASHDASCGLLEQRELERAKVIRELKYLTDHDQKVAIRNNLITNQLFLPPEEWQDESVTVTLRVIAPPALIEHIQTQGLAHTYLITQGPGFEWESYATQKPENFIIEFDAKSGELHLQYPVYQTVFCFESMPRPQVIWVPDVDADLPSALLALPTQALTSPSGAAP